MINQIDKELPYIRYLVPTKWGGREVYLTSRPDSYVEHHVDAFIKKTNPKIRFQLTDDPMKVYQESVGNIPYHWHVWFPGRVISLETMFPLLMLLTAEIEESQGGSVWMHCDSSSMRAPTFFGFYLLTRFDEDEAEEIIQDAKYNDEYKRKSHPLYYAKTSFKLDPHTEEVIRWWKLRGWETAHNFISNLRNK